MLPPHLRALARRITRTSGPIKLAVFGPGKGAPHHDKRTEAVAAIRSEYGATNVEFYMIDDLMDPIGSYEEYIAKLYPMEKEQLEWADVIIFLLTHHRLTALVEFYLAAELDRESKRPILDKCALAISKNLERSPNWLFDAQRLLNGGSGRIAFFDDQDLSHCRVAKVIALELFESVILERAVC